MKCAPEFEWQIFIMGVPLLMRWHANVEMGPRILIAKGFYTKSLEMSYCIYCEADITWVFWHIISLPTAVLAQKAYLG